MKLFITYVSLHNVDIIGEKSEEISFFYCQ